MKKEIITFKEPKSPISEIFRTLRTNIQFMSTKKGLKTILITSTSPSEGKSWIATNLAVTFAQAGKKVAIVDCDMRKGRQFSIFNVPPTPGLSNYLSGIGSSGEDSDSNITTYLRATEVENLYIMTAGNVPPNPSELLVSDQMIDCIDSLKDLFDLVIFDGTPCDLVTDSVIVSRYVDTTIIVTAYKETKIDALEKVKKDIENVGGKIAGVVINKMPITQKAYYSSYYYGSTTNLKQKNSSQKSQQEIERRRIETREKARDIIKQNREDREARNIIQKKNNENEIKYDTVLSDRIINDRPKKSTLYDFDKSETGSLREAEELLRKMNNYVAEEKENLKKED